jgi:hypothetical protein
MESREKEKRNGNEIQRIEGKESGGKGKEEGKR